MRCNPGHTTGADDMVSTKTTSGRKYGAKASQKVARALHEMKRGELRSGGGRENGSRVASKRSRSVSRKREAAAPRFLRHRASGARLGADPRMVLSRRGTFALHARARPASGTRRSHAGARAELHTRGSNCCRACRNSTASSRADALLSAGAAPCYARTRGHAACKVRMRPEDARPCATVVRTPMDRGSGSRYRLSIEAFP